MDITIKSNILSVRKFNQELTLSCFDLCIFLSEAKNKPNCFKYDGTILINIGIIMNLPPTESTSKYYAIYHCSSYEDLKSVQNFIDEEVRKRHGENYILCSSKSF